jgi:hypothetical protein
MSTQPAEQDLVARRGRSGRSGKAHGGHGPANRAPAPARRLRSAVTWLRTRPAPSRKPERCGSWAPVAYMDGLKVQDLYRWSSRCDLPDGHPGDHHSPSDTWR